MEGSRGLGDDCGEPQKKTGMEKKLQVVHSTVNTEGISVDAAVATDLFKMSDFFPC